MGNDSKIKIPEECRGFGEANSGARLRVAKKVVEEFVKKVAPPIGFDNRDEAWTLAVRRRLVEICPKGCYALPDSPNAAKGEYPVDYLWSEEGNLSRLILACQTEWGTGWFGRTNWASVERALEKLLAVKAPFKILIFSSCRKPGLLKPETDFSFEYAKERIELCLRNYPHHLPGEVYIFLDFPQTREVKGIGEYRSLLWLAKRLGETEVDLKEWPGGELIRP
jgi:hypothetical protein